MQKTGLSNISATLTMITTMLGSGVILLPRAFSDLGYFIGSLTFLAVASVTFFTLYTICATATEIQKDKKFSYFGVCYKISPSLAYAADISIALQGYACCLVYLLALKKWVSDLFEIENKWIVTVGFLIPLFILSCLKSLKKLWFTSYISVGSVVFLSCLILLYAVRLEGAEKTEVKINFGKAISVMVFALGCHQNILKVYGDLKEQTLSNAIKVSFSSVFGGSIIYMTIGIVGFFLAGKMSISILEAMLTGELGKKIGNCKEGMFLVKSAVISFCCVMMCAFPMQVQPARDSILNLVGKIFKKEKYGESIRLASTVVFCGSIGALACLENLKYDMVLNIVGATCTTFITFLFPALVFVLGKKGNKILKGLAFTVCIASVILSGYMLYMAIFS